MDHEQAIEILKIIKNDIDKRSCYHEDMDERDRLFEIKSNEIKALDYAIYDMQNIEELEEKIVYLENNIGVLNINIENLKNVEKALNHDIDVKFKYIEKLKEDTRWIDINDRLPIKTKNNKYQEYYVTIKNNLTGSVYVDEAYYIDKEWMSTMEDYDCEIKSFEDVIAWKIKHIPEPYKGGINK